MKTATAYGMVMAVGYNKLGELLTDERLHRSRQGYRSGGTGGLDSRRRHDDGENPREMRIHEREKGDEKGKEKRGKGRYDEDGKG